MSKMIEYNVWITVKNLKNNTSLIIKYWKTYLIMKWTNK